MYIEYRGSGRTKAMVMDLPATGSIVIVPHAPMRRYVEQMIADLRGRDLARSCRVVTVRDRADLDRLVGLRLPVFIDHAFDEEGRNARLVDEVLSMVAAINVQFDPNNPAAA